MAGKVVDVTLRLVDKLSSPLNKIGGNLAKSANQWTRAGKQIQNVGKSMQKVGSSLTKSLTIPIASAGIACVKVASDFEAGMSKVKSIAGLTGEELDTLSKKAKEMGAKTKFSATEATEAFQYMAMAGWEAAEMADGIEGIMYLAGATGEDLASTSDIVTDALTAFGMSAQDTETFVDVLAKTASISNTNVSMMGETFQYVAPVAGSLKYKIEDVSVAIGLMANSGIKASNAGTALRTLMTNLAKPTKQSGQAMKELGISLTDSSGELKSFDTLMRDMKSSFSGLTDAQKAQYASMLAGKTGMSGLLAIVNSSESDFNKLTKAIQDSNGACKEMYDTANDNLKGQLTILKSTVESIAISFGERMTPYVKKLVGWLQKLSDKFNGLSDKQKDMIIKIGLIVAAIGPAILIFGKLVGTVGKVVSVVGKVGKAFKTFGSIAGIISSPAGIVVAVIAGIALAAFLIIKNWSKIKPFLQNVKKWFTDTFGGAGGAIEQFKIAIRNVVSAVAPVVSSISNWFKEQIPKSIDFLKKAFEKIKPILEKIFVKAVNTTAKILVKLSEAFKKVVPIIGIFIKNAASKIAPIMQKIGQSIKKATPYIQQTLTKAFKIIAPIVKTAIKVLSQIANVIGKNIVKCIKSMMPVLQKMGSMFGSIFSFCAKKISSFWNFISPVIKKIIEIILSIAKKLAPAFQSAFKIVGGIIKTFANLIGNIFSGIMGVIGGICDFVSGIFTGNWKKAWKGVKSIFSSIFSTFAGIAKAPINAVIGIINKAIGALNKVKVNIPDWVPTIGGKSFGINIPKIPKLAVGTDNWKGGIVQISEKGGEIVDLPSGSRVYPHDESVKKAYKDGARAKSGGNNITITIPKLADSISVRSDADIDAIAQKLADKLEKVSKNLGGDEIGYSY